MYKTTLFLLFLLVPAGKLFAQDSTFTNSIGMEFVLIEPGSMVVGKYQPTVGDYQPPEEELGAPKRKVLPESAFKVAEEMAKEAAMPGFTVRIDHPYFIGKFEVTQEQWENVMEHNPSVF